MPTFTKSISYSAYNAFNPYGYGTASPDYVWHGWNGTKVNNQYGFAGLRTNGTIHYAFAYRFTTPSWSGDISRIRFTLKLNRETSAATNIMCSLTSFNPASDTSTYTGSTVNDPNRIGYTTLSLNSGENSYTVEFNISSLSKNATYYLVLSPNGGATNYATISTISFSGYITYDAAASEVSAENGYIGSGIAISMTDDGMSHSLSYSFEGITGNIATTTSASYTWTPPDSLMAQIPTSTSGQCRIICTTEAGETETAIILYVPDTIKPNVSLAQIIRINEDPTVQSWGIWLQNFSKVQGKIKATGNYAKIVSWKIDAGAVVFSEKDISEDSIDISEVSDILTTPGTYSITFTVTDSRGRIAALRGQSTYTVRPYAYPSVLNPEIYRCLQDGTRDDRNGTYLYIKATRVFSAVGSNSCTMVAQYKERGQDESQYIIYPSSGSLADDTGYIIGDGSFDILKSYNVRIRVQDALGGSYYSIIISTQSVAFNLKPSQDSGAGFGGYAQDDKILELFNGWKLRVQSDEHILVYDGQQLKTLKQLIAAGGGGGGTSNYNDLSNKPSIGGVILSGNKSLSDLGIKDPFVAVYGTTTLAEIEAAYSSGKTITMVQTSGNSSYLYVLSQRYELSGDVRYAFVLSRRQNVSSLSETVLNVQTAQCSSSGWTMLYTYCEDAEKKVTSISSSSTDVEYPSAKCVYDIVGNIEALLEAML